MVISVLAAYSLSRLKFWGSGILATGIFLTYLVPDTLLFIPLFKIVGWLGLLNSYWVLVLVYPTLSVPFCTWLMIGYFSSIPRELDEAALIDGANHFQMLLKVFIPVAMPGLIAATIFAFTVSWAGFLYPLAFIFNQSSDLYDLIAAVHINASLIITTNRKIEKWADIFFDPVKRLSAYNESIAASTNESISLPSTE